jgi:hypothetical protein
MSRKQKFLTPEEDELHDLKQHQKEREVSDDKYAAKTVEFIVYGTLVIFAMAALYLIFVRVGLPTP